MLYSQTNLFHLVGPSLTRSPCLCWYIFSCISYICLFVFVKPWTHVWLYVDMHLFRYTETHIESHIWYASDILSSWFEASLFTFVRWVQIAWYPNCRPYFFSRVLGSRHWSGKISSHWIYHLSKLLFAN